MHFEKINVKKEMKCLHCEQKFKMKYRNITALLRYLKLQPRYTCKCYDKNCTNSTYLSARIMALDLQPYSIIEDSGSFINKYYCTTV